MNLQNLLPSQADWQARLKLTYAVRGGATRLVGQRHVGPLLVQKPFYPEGAGVCHSVVLHPPAGVAGGDRLDIGVDVADQASAVITTPGAGKWYRCAGTNSAQRVKLVVEDAASLEWLPQENIVFDGACAQWRHSVDLGLRAHYIGWDITCLGRIACGERFTNGRVHGRTEIAQDGRPLWGDHMRIDGGSRLLHSPAGLAGFPVLGTLLAAGGQLQRGLLDACRAVVPEGDARVGVSVLPNLLVARYLGPSTENARTYFVALWRLLRPALLGREACIPRIWAT